jgi:hypothetical protein
MTINCPHCEAEVEVDSSYSKSYLQECISCGQEFKVEFGEEPQPPQDPQPSGKLPSITPEGWVCLKCEVVGKPIKKGGGAKIVALGWFVVLPCSFWLTSASETISAIPLIGVVLNWLMMLLALVGVIYGSIGCLFHGAIVGFGGTRTHCYNCGYDEIIPLRSPKGEEIAKKHGWL